MIHFREMSPDDIGAGEKLCRAANWNQLKRDWESFLKMNPRGNRVAEINELVVGTVTTLDYDDDFSWIGMVLVDPLHRKQGIGTALLKEALRILQNRKTVKLDATPAGREVYLKLGFQDEYRLSRMVGTVTIEKNETENAMRMTAGDIPELLSFDKNIFGADRSILLEWQFSGAPGYAFVEKRNNVIVGYCMGRHGYNFEQIGPIVAMNTDIAIRLTSAALSNCKGKAVAIDAMHFETAWLQWLAGLGLQEQRPFVRMFRGTNEIMAIPQLQFGIMGPEFG